MRKKFLIFLPGILILVLLFFCVLGKGQDSTNLEETRFAEEDFVSDVSFQLVNRSDEDDIQVFVLSVHNDRNDEIAYGDYYAIEILLGDKWYLFYELQEWNDIAYYVKPDCSSEVVISADSCLEMAKGRYRIVKDLLIDNGASYQEGYIAAEFCVD